MRGGTRGGDTAVDSLALRRVGETHFPPCSARANGSLFLSLPLSCRPLFSPHASRSSFFISLYGLIPSFPRRVRYIYRLVSPSGSCLYHTATSPGPRSRRSPSKTVSPPRFMFPPTQRRIDPFLLSDVYVRGATWRPPPDRVREHTSHPRATDYPSAVTQSAAASAPPSCRGSFLAFETPFQRFRHPPLRPGSRRLPRVSSFDGASWTRGFRIACGRFTRASAPRTGRSNVTTPLDAPSEAFRSTSTAMDKLFTSCIPRAS